MPVPDAGLEQTFDVNDDGSLTPVYSMVLDIAPPEPGESIAIHNQQQLPFDRCANADVRPQ